MGWFAATPPGCTIRGAANSRPGSESDRPAEVRADLVEYLVITFPDRTALGSVVPALTAVARSAQVRVLDIAVLARAADGALDVLELADLEDLSALGAIAGELGLLSENDLHLAAGAVRPGEAAIVLVAEDRWAEELSVAVQRAGGQIAAGERVSAALVEDALSSQPDDEPGG
jgi:Family of unknown function (DUF6325)